MRRPTALGSSDYGYSRGSRRARIVLAACAASALLALTACSGSSGGAEQTTAAAIDGGAPVPPTLTHPPDFALKDQSGRQVRLSAERGHTVVVAFLYTHCPDVCPLIAEHLADGLKELTPSQRAGVRVLSVSVDPRGDTPGAVRRFIAVHRLPEQFRYLTGTQAQLEPIWSAYNVAAVPNAKNGAEIDHSAYELFIDPSGVARVLFDAQVTPTQTRRAIQSIGA